MKAKQLYAAFLAVLLASPAFGQEQGPIHEPDPLGREGSEDPMEELRELFLEVERNLEQIDEDLANAGAGEVPLEEVADAGIDDLLRRTEQLSIDAQLKIDRILEIAQQMGQGQGSGSSSSPPKGESPLDQPRDNGPRQQENTPREPQKEPGGQEEQEGSEEPKDGNKPEDSPQDNPEDGENTSGQLPQQSRGDAVDPGSDADQWGFLPDHVRETFRNQGRDELPIRYRDWIDAYYRRLSRTDG